MRGIGSLSHERIAGALGLSKGAVSKYVARAQVLGLTWAGLTAPDEATVEARLCSSAPSQ